MADSQLFDQILDNTPKLSAIALQVLQKLSQPDCSFDEIGTLVRYDPALCGKMLKMVNSALFGLSRPVTSIDRTLALLGLGRVRSLVVSASLGALEWQSVPWLAEYWRSSVAGAITARELARRLGSTDPETELVAGLLRDLGMLVMQESHPTKYAQVLAQSPENLARRQCELEEEILGVNHADLSAELLKRWHLPEDITEPIRFHHHPHRAADRLGIIASRAYLLHFATLIAQLPLPGCPPAAVEDVVRLGQVRFGMGVEELDHFLESLNQKVAEMASLLQVQIADYPMQPSLVKRAIEQLAKLV